MDSYGSLWEMDTTKSTLRGTLILVMMTVALFGLHWHQLEQRDACQHRLEHMVPALSAFAAKNQGRLPISSAEMLAAVGDDAKSYVLACGPTATPKDACYWKRGTPLPYLWDARPHRFVGGVHVLFTDGHIETSNGVP